jgi:hypothetical protein
MGKVTITGMLLKILERLVRFAVRGLKVELVRAGGLNCWARRLSSFLLGHGDVEYTVLE